MNCRDFLKEFEERTALTESANAHLSECGDCRQATAVQTRVWQVIERFEPIAAPNDFNFRVKARIADHKPNDYRSSFLPVLRYVLPLGVVCLLFAFVIYNGVFSLENESAPQVAEGNFRVPTQKENPPPNSPAIGQTGEISEPSKVEPAIVSNPIASAPENNKRPPTSENETRFTVAKTDKNAKKLPANIVKNEENFKGSRDIASTRENAALPRGINPTQTVENPAAFGKINSVTAEQILSELGIEIVSENGRRQVKKITPNSVAERSDVRVGDWVEAIDGEKLMSEPIRAKTIEGKKLTVTRGAAKIEILLRN